MNNRLIARPPMAYLTVGAVALLCAWFFSRAPETDFSGTSSSEMTGNTQPTTAAGHGFTLFADIADLDPALLDRPLLTKGRRPFSAVMEPEEVLVEPEPISEPDLIEEPPKNSPRPQIAMRGYINSDGAPKALLIWNDDPNEHWYAMAAEKDGWRIVAIESQSVRVSDGTDEITVKLYDE